MAKTLRELVDEAVAQAFHDGDFSSHSELLRQSVMLEVRDALTGDPEAFREWLEDECEGPK